MDNFRHAALTSTYTNVLPSTDTLTAQSPSRAHREPYKGVARGVLVAIGIALCIMPDAGGSENVHRYTAKQYAYYSLNKNVKEYKCLSQLYGKESAWNHNAANGNHYGIPQGRSDYLLTATPYQQINWGIEYNLNRYGSMCEAWYHWLKYKWH